MNIGITEDEFADDIQIQKLTQEQNYFSDINLMDQAKLQFQNDEDYRDMLQMSEQKVQTEINESEYRLQVYEQAMADEDMYAHIQKDTAMMAKLKAAQAAEQERLDKAKKKAGKTQMMTGVATMAVGAAAMYASSGTVGSSMVVSGAAQTHQGSQA